MCQKCGYSKSISALDFHHRNPSEKKFGISIGIAKCLPMIEIKKETDKCDLLCSNCHHEIHDLEN